MTPQPALDAEQAAIAKECIFYRAIHEQSHVRRAVTERLGSCESHFQRIWAAVPSDPVRPSDRGRERLAPSPPSEPGVQFSRDGLSSQLFPHRDWRANRWASDIVKIPRSAKKAFGHCW